MSSRLAEPVAAVMDEHLVSIKIDREERPDVDQIDMAALGALARHDAGGSGPN